MMSRTITVTLYEYHELDDRAKRRASEVIAINLDQDDYSAMQSVGYSKVLWRMV